MIGEPYEKLAEPVDSRLTRLTGLSQLRTGD